MLSRRIALTSLATAAIAVAVGCSSAGDQAPTEEATTSEPEALAKCPGTSDFKQFSCPTSWASAAKPEDCTCVSSRYDCMAPNPQASLDGDMNRARYLNGTVGSWPVAAGITVYDGNHKKLGVGKSTRILVNYGQKKKMFGRTYVLARTESVEQPDATPGWVDAACVGWDGQTTPPASCESAPEPAVKMPAVVGRRPPVAAQAHKKKYRFRSTLPAAVTGLFPDGGNPYDVKVVCNTDDAHMALVDYLPRERNGGNVTTVSLLFTLPGQMPALSGIAGDVFEVAHREGATTVRDDVTFYRLIDVPAVLVRLYKPSSPEPYLAEDSQVPFVYGYVVYTRADGQRAKRFGWVAYLALERA